MDFPLTVHLINRRDRLDRLIAAIQNIRALGITTQINVVEATSPEKAQQDRHHIITSQAYSNLCKRGPSQQMLVTWGAVACAASHYQCWQKASWTDDYSFHLILEDDIRFPDPEVFKFDLQRALDILKSENEHSERNITKRSSITLFNSEVMSSSHSSTNQDNLQRVKDIFRNLHCYLIDSYSAEFLTKHCQRFTYQVDIQLGLLAREQCNKQFGFRILNFPHSGTAQDKSFTSDVQPQNPSAEVLTELLQGVPQSVCSVVENYLTPIQENYNNYAHIPTNDASALSDYY